MDTTPENQKIQNLVSELKPIDIRSALFKSKDFNFIVTGKDEDGKTYYEKSTSIEDIPIAVLTEQQYKDYVEGTRLIDGPFIYTNEVLKKKVAEKYLESVLEVIY